MTIPSNPRNAEEALWLEGARRIPSPNCDDRPEGIAVDLVVIHGISLPPGVFGGDWIEQLFLNRLPRYRHPFFREIHHLRVSSHLLIRRDGALVQFVPLNRRAWHAGVSSFQGRERCNDYSIGIELEGADRIPYTDLQYDVLARTIRRIMSRFPAITPERVVGHCHIAPDRKTDPGPAFEWRRIRELLASRP